MNNSIYLGSLLRRIPGITVDFWIIPKLLERAARWSVVYSNLFFKWVCFHAEFTLVRYAYAVHLVFLHGCNFKSIKSIKSARDSRVFA